MVYPIVNGLIINDGKILLLKRNKWPFANLWGMPGGKIEYGESIEEAVIREIKEETGLNAEFKSVKGIVNEVVFDKKTKETVLHSLIFVCAVSINKFKIKESEEGEIKWFYLKDLYEIKSQMIPSDYLMIKRFLELTKIGFSNTIKTAEPFRSELRSLSRRRVKSKTIKLYKVKMIENEQKYIIEKTDL